VSSGRKRVAVVGGGWAGLAAAVQATDDGHAITLFEMAGQLGGRARSVKVNGLTLDNGQHILIGAYRETLRLMQRVGVDSGRALHRKRRGTEHHEHIEQFNRDTVVTVNKESLGLKRPRQPSIAFLRRRTLRPEGPRR